MNSFLTQLQLRYLKQECSGEFIPMLLVHSQFDCPARTSEAESMVPTLYIACPKLEVQAEWELGINLTTRKLHLWNAHEMYLYDFRGFIKWGKPNLESCNCPLCPGYYPCFTVYPRWNLTQAIWLWCSVLWSSELMTCAFYGQKGEWGCWGKKPFLYRLKLRIVFYVFKAVLSLDIYMSVGRW
jgi:hypothetical protein